MNNYRRGTLHRERRTTTTVQGTLHTERRTRFSSRTGAGEVSSDAGAGPDTGAHSYQWGRHRRIQGPNTPGGHVAAASHLSKVRVVARRREQAGKISGSRQTENETMNSLKHRKPRCRRKDKIREPLRRRRWPPLAQDSTSWSIY